MSLTPFHLAIPVSNLVEAESFYGDLLGCGRGRSSSQWIDWSFFGHQLVTHVVNSSEQTSNFNKVDQKSVPVPHFGVVLEWSDWENLAKRLTDAAYPMHIEPYVRFEGEVGEQGTFFLFDPFGNALEFKSFKDLSQLFNK